MGTAGLQKPLRNRSNSSSDIPVHPGTVEALIGFGKVGRKRQALGWGQGGDPRVNLLLGNVARRIPEPVALGFDATIIHGPMPPGIRISLHRIMNKHRHLHILYVVRCSASRFQAFKWSRHRDTL